MYTHFLLNGINAVEVSLSFYRKFLMEFDLEEGSEQKNTDLLYAIMTLHDGITLLSKKLLADVNEMLLFNEANYNEAFGLVKMSYKKKRPYMQAYYKMHGDFEVPGIDYTLLVNRLASEYSLDVDACKYLLDLEDMRKRFVYLDVHNNFWIYPMIDCFNACLILLRNFYIPKLHIQEHATGFKNTVKQLIQMGDGMKEIIYSSSQQAFIQLTSELMEEFLESDDLHNYLNIKIEIKSFRRCHQESHPNDEQLSIDYLYFGYANTLKIRFLHNVAQKTTVLVDDKTNYILALIDYKDVELSLLSEVVEFAMYLPMKKILCDCIESSEAYWRQERYFKRIEDYKSGLETMFLLRQKIVDDLSMDTKERMLIEFRRSIEF